MQTIKGILTVAAVLTFSVAAWYMLALFVGGVLGTVAQNAGWGV